MLINSLETCNMVGLDVFDLDEAQNNVATGQPMDAQVLEVQFLFHRPK